MGLFSPIKWNTVHVSNKTVRVRFRGHHGRYRRTGYIVIEKSDCGKERARLVHATNWQPLDLDWAKIKVGIIKPTEAPNANS